MCFSAVTAPDDSGWPQLRGLPYANTYVQYGILKLTHSTCSDRSRVPCKRRVPDTGRGSRQIVLIEAGGFYPAIYGIVNDTKIFVCINDTPLLNLTFLYVSKYTNKNIIFSREFLSPGTMFQRTKIRRYGRKFQHS